MTDDSIVDDDRCVIPWCRRPKAGEGKYCPRCAGQVPRRSREEDED